MKLLIITSLISALTVCSFDTLGNDKLDHNGKMAIAWALQTANNPESVCVRSHINYLGILEFSLDGWQKILNLYPVTTGNASRELLHFTKIKLRITNNLESKQHWREYKVIREFCKVNGKML